MFRVPADVADAMMGLVGCHWRVEQGVRQLNVARDIVAK